MGCLESPSCSEIILTISRVASYGTVYKQSSFLHLASPSSKTWGEDKCCSFSTGSQGIECSRWWLTAFTVGFLFLALGESCRGEGKEELPKERERSQLQAPAQACGVWDYWERSCHLNPFHPLSTGSQPAFQSSSTSCQPFPCPSHPCWSPSQALLSPA